MADDAGSVTGWCTGGPLNGRQITVRSGSGFMAADKAAGRAWIYRRQLDGIFQVSIDHDDSLNYPHGATTGERTLDWDRLPLSADPVPVVSLGDSPEAYAGDPVDDGWDDTKETA